MMKMTGKGQSLVKEEDEWDKEGGDVTNIRSGWLKWKSWHKPEEEVKQERKFRNVSSGCQIEHWISLNVHKW